MTRYTVTAERGERLPVWVLQCVEFPGAISEVRKLTDAARMMAEAIGFVADMEVSEDDIDVVPALGPGVRELLDQAREHRAEAQRLAEEASTEFRKVARELSERSVSVRDIGVILDVSYQRAHQLVQG